MQISCVRPCLVSRADMETIYSRFVYCRNKLAIAPLPIEGLIEVISDERLTGGELVKMNHDDLSALLSEYGAK